MRRCGTRQKEQGGLAVLTAFLMALTASSATAGVVQPRVSIVGGTGSPGGTVSVALGLADDVDNAGVSAGIDLLFEDDKLDFMPPVATSCDVDPRIASTHGIGGRILEPGILNLEIFVLGTPDPLPTLGNGILATCDFRIADDAPLGTSPLVIQSPFLGDDAGMEIPVTVEDGEITIVEAVPTETPTITSTPASSPTATPSEGVGTPTATDTPGTPTATATDTPVTEGPTATATVAVTATATATRTNTVRTPPQTPSVTGTAQATATRTSSTPTRTRTSGPGPSNEDDGCNVVAPGSSDFGGTLALLLAPALLIWVRRRA